MERGIWVKFARDTSPSGDSEYVETSAVMAKYNPFAEKAGMRKIAEQPPPKEALKIAQILADLGYSNQLLGSEKYVVARPKA